MKKNITIILTTALIIFTMMFAEYRFIMHNIHPYRGENGTVYLEIFGIMDTYYAETLIQEGK